MVLVAVVLGTAVDDHSNNSNNDVVVHDSFRGSLFTRGAY